MFHRAAAEPQAAVICRNRAAPMNPSRHLVPCACRSPSLSCSPSPASPQPTTTAPPRSTRSARSKREIASALSTHGCAVACQALGSMARAADRLCALIPGPGAPTPAPGCETPSAKSTKRAPSAPWTPGTCLRRRKPRSPCCLPAAAASCAGAPALRGAGGGRRVSSAEARRVRGLRRRGRRPRTRCGRDCGARGDRGARAQAAAPALNYGCQVDRGRLQPAPGALADSPARPSPEGARENTNRKRS